VNGDGPASSASDLLATYIYDRLLGRDSLAAVYDRQLADHKARVTEGEKRVAGTLAQRAARLAPLKHPLEAFAGTYQHPSLGTMTWRVVAGGLEVRMGVATSRAEVYDAAKDQLRVDLFDGGMVAGFEFPAGGPGPTTASAPAAAVTMNGERFARRE
jgi:hypothetical protein